MAKSAVFITYYIDVVAQSTVLYLKNGGHLNVVYLIRFNKS